MSKERFMFSRTAVSPRKNEELKKQNQEARAAKLNYLKSKLYRNGIIEQLIALQGMLDGYHVIICQYIVVPDKTWEFAVHDTMRERVFYAGLVDGQPMEEFMVKETLNQLIPVVKHRYATKGQNVLPACPVSTTDMYSHFIDITTPDEIRIR